MATPNDDKIKAKLCKLMELARQGIHQAVVSGNQMSYYGHWDTRNGEPAWVPHNTNK